MCHGMWLRAQRAQRQVRDVGDAPRPAQDLLVRARRPSATRSRPRPRRRRRAGRSRASDALAEVQQTLKHMCESSGMTSTSQKRHAPRRPPAQRVGRLGDQPMARHHARQLLQRVDAAERAQRQRQSPVVGVEQDGRLEDVQAAVGMRQHVAARAPPGTGDRGRESASHTVTSRLRASSRPVAISSSSTRRAAQVRLDDLPRTSPGRSGCNVISKCPKRARSARSGARRARGAAGRAPRTPARPRRARAAPSGWPDSRASSARISSLSRIGRHEHQVVQRLEARQAARRGQPVAPLGQVQARAGRSASRP